MIKNKERIINQVILNERNKTLDLINDVMLDIDSGKYGSGLGLRLIKGIIAGRIKAKQEELNKKG